MTGQRDYWNGPGTAKSFTTPFPMEPFRAHVDREARILDYGCGYGRVLAQLRDQGWNDTIGLDFSAKMVRRGRKLHPDLDMGVCAPAGVPFPAGSFDAVLLLAVLTCMGENQTQDDLAARLHGTLRPGGVIVVNDFLLNNDQRSLDRYRTGLEAHGTYGMFEIDGGAVMRHHEPGRLRSLFEAFELLFEEETAFVTMNGHPALGWTFVGRKK